MVGLQLITVMVIKNLKVYGLRQKQWRHKSNGLPFFMSSIHYTYDAHKIK